MTIVRVLLAAGLSSLLAASLHAAEAWRVAVIPKGTTHEFWKSVHAGAVKAQRELAEQNVRVDIIWKGPLREDDRDQQIQVVENFTSQRVDAIVLSPLDSRALVVPVASAERAKIPVVVIDSGLKGDRYTSFVATDNYKAGSLAGEEMARLLGNKGNVIVLRYQAGSASTEERENGFLDALKKEPGIKVISSQQYAGPTRESAFQAAQNLLNRYGKEVNGMFAAAEPVTTGILMALRNISKAGGTVKLVGVDAGTQPVEALKKGDVQALVVQNPMRIGYLGVRTALQRLQGKPVEKRIDTGVTVVTTANMDQPDIKELLNPPLEKYLN